MELTSAAKFSKISTHTPLARRDSSCAPSAQKQQNFYSHASCEARHGAARRSTGRTNFYSHASCEARRKDFMKECNAHKISTHTPLARRDRPFGCALVSESDFYSHASCEARRKLRMQKKCCSISTHTPLARRDASITPAADTLVISTHTPLARRDDRHDQIRYFRN